MKKVIELKTDISTGDKYFTLEDLVDLLPIEQIKHYKIETIDEQNHLIITFYDENGNLIKTKRI